MSARRARCGKPWAGQCPRSQTGPTIGHLCARPPGHQEHGVCMCRCGAVRPDSPHDVYAEITLHPPGVTVYGMPADEYVIQFAAAVGRRALAAAAGDLLAELEQIPGQQSLW